MYQDGLTEIQNVFSNLADEKLRAAIVVAIKEDGELVSGNFGTLESICLLTETARLVTMNKLATVFKEA